MRIPAVVGLALSLAAVVSCASCGRQLRLDNEARALATVRAILSAQFAFSADCGGFAPSLPALGRSGVLGAEFSASDTLSRGGYTFTLASSGPGGSGTCGDVFQHFAVTATPDPPNDIGARYLRGTDDGEVRAAGGPDFANATIVN
jgi:hypothetical protein